MNFKKGFRSKEERAFAKKAGFKSPKERNYLLQIGFPEYKYFQASFDETFDDFMKTCKSLRKIVKKFLKGEEDQKIINSFISIIQLLIPQLDELRDTMIIYYKVPIRDFKKKILLWFYLIKSQKILEKANKILNNDF